MKMTVKPKSAPKPHKPGELMETRIKWHPDQKSVTVTHMHAPKSKTGMDMMGGPSSQDQAYSTRHEALHNVAQHAGVASEMVDTPEPGDEAAEENDDAGAGVGNLGSERVAKKTKIIPAESVRK
jgi:hypothetical protein